MAAKPLRSDSHQQSRVMTVSSGSPKSGHISERRSLLRHPRSCQVLPAPQCQRRGQPAGKKDEIAEHSGIVRAWQIHGPLNNPCLGLGLVCKPWRPPSRPVCACNQHNEPACGAQDFVAIHIVPSISRQSLAPLNGIYCVRGERCQAGDKKVPRQQPGLS